MALSSEDRGDVKKAMGAAMAKKVSTATRDQHPANKKYWARKSKQLGADAEKFYSGDKAEHAKVTASMRAKTNALRGKLDKASGARDVTKAYKKQNPSSTATGVHDVMRKS